MWRYFGQVRPEFAIPPGPGQESVWDYPRPPVVVPDTRLVVVRTVGASIAESRASLRILETASPPAYYLPRADVDMTRLVRVPGRSVCEWKGEAGYWALARDPERPVAWSYEQPTAAFAAISGALAFYPGRVECSVDGQPVRPQAGGFYGGWVTDEIVGPCKGAPGTGHW